MGNNKFHEAINLPNLMMWLTCRTPLMCHGAYLSFQGDVSARCQWLSSTGQIYFCVWVGVWLLLMYHAGREVWTVICLCVSSLRQVKLTCRSSGGRKKFAGKRQGTVDCFTSLAQFVIFSCAFYSRDPFSRTIFHYHYWNVPFLLQTPSPTISLTVAAFNSLKYDSIDNLEGTNRPRITMCYFVPVPFKSDRHSL